MAENNNQNHYHSAVKFSEDNCACGNVSRLLVCCHQVWLLQVSLDNHQGQHTDGCGVCCGYVSALMQGYEAEKLVLKGQCVHIRDLLDYFRRHR